MSKLVIKNIIILLAIIIPWVLRFKQIYSGFNIKNVFIFLEGSFTVV